MAQHQDDGGYAGAKEDVGRQANHGLQVVVFNESFADSAFLTAPKQHAVGQDDGHDAAGLEVIKIVQQEGVVGLGLGCQAKAGVAGVAVFVLRVPLL